MERQLLSAAELGSRHGVGRERMEWLLSELGLRQEHDDGSTLYDSAEVERLLALRDDRLMRSAAELLDYVEDAGLAAEVLHRAFFELRLAWLQSRAAGDVIDVLRRQLASRLPPLHAIQRARAGAGGPGELELLQRFEQTLVAALHERRNQRSSPGDANSSKEEADAILARADAMPAAPEGPPARKRKGH